MSDYFDLYARVIVLGSSRSGTLAMFLFYTACKSFTVLARFVACLLVVSHML
jgi:hypothetical protein